MGTRTMFVPAALLLCALNAHAAASNPPPRAAAHLQMSWSLSSVPKAPAPPMSPRALEAMAPILVISPLLDTHKEPRHKLGDLLIDVFACFGWTLAVYLAIADLRQYRRWRTDTAGAAA